MRLEGLEEPPRPRSLGRGVLAGLVREPHGVDDDVVGHVPTGVGGGVVGDSATAPPMWNIAEYDRGKLAV